jgi:hypothetical protein
MIFAALRNRCRDAEEFVRRQVQMGLDTVVELHPHFAPGSYGWWEHRDLPGLPVRYHPAVEIVETSTPGPQGQVILRKEYHTPAGTLYTEVQRSADWPYGGHVPFLDDYLIPRARKHLVTGPEDLAPLQYLLQPPTAQDLAAFRRWAEQARRLAEELGLLLAGGWGAVGDVACWLCGLEELIWLALDEPDFVADLLGIIAAWNRQRMQVMLEAGVDLFIRRGWYESTDFWSPALYERFLLPGLAAEAELAHQAGAKFGYIMTSGTLPLLERMLAAGVDVLIGVDPVQGKGTDLREMKRRTVGRMALWGGVNGFLTVEQGDEAQVRAAVREAMAILAPGGGFILSPVDNVSADDEKTWRNVAALIDEWQRLR